MANAEILIYNSATIMIMMASGYGATALAAVAMVMAGS